MKALSDPNRIRVVKLLEDTELCACEIIDLLGLAQSTVSRHMKLLEDAGLIYSRRKGAWLHYRLAEKDESDAGVMLQHLHRWQGSDETLDELKRELPAVKKRQLCQKPDGTES